MKHQRNILTPTSHAENALGIWISILVKEDRELTMFKAIYLRSDNAIVGTEQGTV